MMGCMYVKVRDQTWATGSLFAWLQLSPSGLSWPTPSLSHLPSPGDICKEFMMTEIRLKKTWGLGATAGNAAQLGECLPSMHEALDSIPGVK